MTIRSHKPKTPISMLWTDGAPKKPIAFALLLALLPASGCSLLGSKEDILPQSGPTMLDIYHSHFAGGGAPAPASDRAPAIKPYRQPDRRGDGVSDDRSYTRDALNEIRVLFPRLRNQTLILYRFPHLSRGGHPVPGYATAFDLYPQTEYALPGEPEEGY